MKRNLLRFGTGGIPLSTQIVEHEGEKLTGRQSGIIRTKQLQLTHIEMEFVHGVRISQSECEKIRNLSKDEEISISLHGPYYVNLASFEKPKYYASLNHIQKTIQTGSWMGADSITFHAAFYQDRPSAEISDLVYKGISEAIKKTKIENEDKGSVLPLISPETTGKPSQWGTIEEIVNVANRINHDLGTFAVSICVDFAHLHARSNGKNNSYEETASNIELIADKLGPQALENLHIHMSGIDYGQKGEKKHLILEEADLNYKEILKALFDRNVGGFVVCESPILEEDALILKNYYDTLTSKDSK